ncbi:MAG: chemotaxis response regulator protein-glutamate methylesterase [Gammaproteobacteria bacterium]|nr:chemotaxis response regulator protein-glutamate methylesterase [Gammaproteobacteria bacterium]MBT8134742.1 chemotaxis response regulator protein-glutamate methylesterase [Gammaproteobacteria bacterium]NNJ49666.1 chemotaxis response regulator protein-glutamate methylesterase [Gammaproteobacteria bacterium]
MTTKRKIRVLIVDDSAVIRKILSEILSSDDEIEVVGTAIDPYIARDKIKRLHPDVLTLDVEMPKMNGISFLKNLMRLRPMPVIMVSSLTQKGADVALEALGLGAIDYVGKPDAKSKNKLSDYAEEIISKVKIAASTSKDLEIGGGIQRNFKPSTGTPSTIKSLTTDCSQEIIAIGASTGGTEAIKDILINLQPASFSMVIVQHIPKAFSKAFADRVNNLTTLEVEEAIDKQKILPGHVYVAPGDQHLTIVKRKDSYYCRLEDSEPYNRHKPSVDVLFRSVCKHAGNNAIGVLLTGMGSDGARGLKELQDSGAITIAQDEHSSIVWGMPGEAVKLQAADYVLPLDIIPDKLTTLISRNNKNSNKS